MRNHDDLDLLRHSPAAERAAHLTRRQFFGRSATGIGTAALASLLGPGALARGAGRTAPAGPHFAPKAKRVIYLFMSGAPSQFETFDWKPKLRDMFDQELPDSIRNGQRITTMTSGQSRFPIAPSKFDFARHGESGAEVSETLPYTAKMVDDLCIMRSVHTDAINHDPAITFMQTGSEQPGRPSFGSWLSYGLGTMNRDLPSFVVMTPRWKGRAEAQALYQRLWGARVPARANIRAWPCAQAATRCCTWATPPASIARRGAEMLDVVAALNERKADEVGDPEIRARIEQYEMAFRMQAAVPELTDLSKEPQSVLDLYGPDATNPGTFGASCLLARRLIERDVRFVQIYHRGWDQHFNLPERPLQRLPRHRPALPRPHPGPQAARAARGHPGDLGRRVRADDLLPGRPRSRETTAATTTRAASRCGWQAPGSRRARSTGARTTSPTTSSRIPLSVYDLNATILHLLGLDHERLTYRHAGRDFRLTDVHGEVRQALLA